MMIDLKTNLIAFVHESTHLWESKVRSCLLKFDDLLILSNNGLRMINLGNQKQKIVKKADKTEYMLHSISSCNDLRLENSNHIKLRENNQN